MKNKQRTEPTRDLVLATAKTITPPPTKRDLLYAAALAIHKEQDDKAKKVRDSKADAFAQLKVDVLKNFPLPKGAEAELTEHYWRGGYEPTLIVRIKIPTAFAERFTEIGKVQVPRVEPTQNIYRELVKEANDRTRVTAALLADPVIKSKLLKLGEALLDGGAIAV